MVDIFSINIFFCLAGPPSVHSPHLVHSGGKVTISTSGALQPVVRAPSVESLSSHEQHTRAVVSPHPREG